ncbi:MAPEG family protein [Paraglaciecola aquimarina]|uniref:MAPEG family protein n=1 Tax=Paraglaciecola algarum TaxID=3050085 RepID=A0ABS9D8B2_9ALTE|nr:MAPEG family protein [Paraglaciecola sp. G1-23]MCF2947906.1 MAPEG family protein [Paraglaciecola sp. G1-23]
MNTTIFVLLSYIGLIVFLLVFLGIYRTSLVLNRTKKANGFKPDGSDVPDFGQRLTRVQANAVECFPFIGGLLLLALATNSAVITDGLALWLLAARIGQAGIHLISTSILAVQIRFAFFLIQIGICVYWLGLFVSKFS